MGSDKYLIHFDPCYVIRGIEFGRMALKESPMNQAEMTCPKCQGEMESGYLIDHSHVALLASLWARGKPKKHWWFSLQTNNAITRPSPSDQIPVGTYRCKTCGFLESYARKEFAVK